MTDTLARALAPSDTGIDRRKLLKMGVWAAPVVVLATAAPAAAASPGDITPAAAATIKKGQGNEVLISLAATAKVAVTATLVVTSADSKKPGEWPGKVAGTTPQLNTQGPGSVVFTFPAFQKHDNTTAYTYTITFTVGKDPINGVLRTGPVVVSA